MREGRGAHDGAGGAARARPWCATAPQFNNCVERSFSLGKSCQDPMSAAIARELKCARAGSSEVVFPSARKWNESLPFKSHGLRHTFVSVAHDLGMNEIFVSLLVGHALTGVHASYLTRLVVGGGPGLRAAQRRISRRILDLLDDGARPQ